MLSWCLFQAPTVATIVPGSANTAAWTPEPCSPRTQLAERNSSTCSGKLSSRLHQFETSRYGHIFHRLSCLEYSPSSDSVAFLGAARQADAPLWARGTWIAKLVVKYAHQRVRCIVARRAAMRVTGQANTATDHQIVVSGVISEAVGFYPAKRVDHSNHPVRRARRQQQHEFVQRRTQELLRDDDLGMKSSSQ